MPRRGSGYYGYYPDYRREPRRRIPSPLPYLLIALLAGAGLVYFHFFAFQNISGRVLNAYNSKPLAGVPVVLSEVAVAGATVTTATVTAVPVSPSVSVTATTAPDGSFLFEKVPDRRIISVQVEGFAPEQLDATGKRNVEIRLVPNVLTGKVTAPDGKPVVGASVIAGASRAITGPDGTYRLKDLPQEHRLVVKAPGYLATEVQFGQVLTQDVTLQPFVVRAIYLSADTIASPGKLQSLLDLVDRTELNAVVIDVKADNSGLVLYDSKLPAVQQMGTKQQIIPDLDALLADLNRRNIYSIARLPVFWDQAATSARPEWALKSKKAPGQLWVDSYGKRWTNPYNPEVWDYNISIATEVALKGFKEIQFDSAYFPSDGELEDIDYGPEGAGKKRVDAIGGFLSRAYEALSPLGVYVAVDTFGLTPFVQDDMGIGHTLETLAAHVDYICPAIYPSMFGDGFMGLAKPAEHPAEVVAQTMRSGVARIASTPARIRPWLQDFSLKVEYDPAKVRAEIDTAEQNGAVGWMLWNFNNVYTEGALKAP